MTPLAISLVALGIVFLVILAALSIRFCLRRWGHNDGNDVGQHLLAGAQNAVDVTKNIFPKSDDGGRTENLLNASQPLPVSLPNSDCNITVSKKDDFNEVYRASGPV